MPQVIPAVMTAISTIGAWQIGSFAVGSFLLNTVSSLALTAIAGKLAGKPDFPKSGIQTEHTTAGSTEPRRFILGLTATAGHAITPPMTWDTKGENKNLTNVIVLSDAPIDSVIGYILDGESTNTIGAVTDKGHRLSGRFDGHAWVDFHDGRQTAPSTVLRTHLGNYPERPITSDMVMKDCAYVVATYHYSHDNPRFSNIPALRAIVRGMRVYDWRDPSQIWGDETTYKFSANPVVLIYNILRGIRIGNHVYGVGAKASYLPLSYWTTAANICDEPSTVTEDIPAGFEWAFEAKRYQAGLEIGTDTEPLSAIDEFLRTCSGQLAEVGGQYIIRVAEPAMPSAHIDDGVILADQPTEYTVTRGLESRHNTWGAKYPDPRQMFEENESVPYFKQEWIDEDNGRRLDMSLSLPACPFPNQIPKLLRENAHDARRFREHTIVLPPSYIGLNLLDTISWTSETNNYSSKLFEIIGKTVDPHTLAVGLQLKERSPEDYIPNAVTDNRLPEVPSLKPVDPIITVHGFYATGFALKDTLGQDRRAAIQIMFDDDVNYDAISFEVRVKGSTEIFASGAIHDLTSGQHVVSESILGNTVYQVRVRPLASGIATEWGAWLDVTTPNIGLSADDIAMPAPPTPGHSSMTSPEYGSILIEWPAGPASVIYYEVQVQQAGQNPIIFQTATNRYRIDNLTPGLTFLSRVRAVNGLGVKSNWNGQVSVVVSGADFSIARPTMTSVKGGFNTIWAEWTRNTQKHFSHYEVAASTSAAAAINPTSWIETTSNSHAFVDLPEDVTRWINVRAVSIGGIKSGWTSAQSAKTTLFPEMDVPDYSITANKMFAGEVITLSAQIKDAIINNAHIANLSAAKLMAGTALASTITVSGEALSSIQGKANDPAAQVNAGSTQIDPGKIVVSGATTLADWRMGGDESRINGGVVAPNTLKANSAVIGLRNITVIDIEFSANDPSPDHVSWTAGKIQYIDDDGSTAEVSIAAGSAEWVTDTLYLYWTKGQGSLLASINLGMVVGTDNVTIATYSGGSRLNESFGRTLIEGDWIKTRAINADHIGVDELSAISATMGQLTVNDQLTIAPGGRMLANKSTPFDPSDGFFIGKTRAFDGDICITDPYLNPYRHGNNGWTGVGGSYMHVYSNPDNTSGYIWSIQTGTNSDVLGPALNSDSIIWTGEKNADSFVIDITFSRSPTWPTPASAGTSGAGIMFEWQTDVVNEDGRVWIPLQSELLKSTNNERRTISVVVHKPVGLLGNFVRHNFQFFTNYVPEVGPVFGPKSGKHIRLYSINISTNAGDSVNGAPVRDDYVIAASRVGDDGREQSLRFSGNGFEITNAKHLVLGDATESQHHVVTESTLTPIAIPNSATRIRFPMISGGGGAGVIFDGSGNAIASPPAGQTHVRLYDGSTLMMSFTAQGGQRGTHSTRKGQDSPRGEGGIEMGSNGAGYGSGGAGFVHEDYKLTVGSYRTDRDGGNAGQHTSTDWIDISGWSNPRMLVHIGNGGVGATVAGPRGGKAGDGAPGVVEYETTEAVYHPADVIPLYPTATGYFTKPANAAGSFPDLGTGLWFISCQTNPMSIRITTRQPDLGYNGPNTYQLDASTERSASFISWGTPRYESTANSRQIVYHFYKMGD